MNRQEINRILKLHIFRNLDVSRETGISVNIISGMTSERLNIEKVSQDKIDKLNQYFASFNFDYSRPEDIKRETIYTQL